MLHMKRTKYMQSGRRGKDGKQWKYTARYNRKTIDIFACSFKRIVSVPRSMKIIITTIIIIISSNSSSRNNRTGSVGIIVFTLALDSVRYTISFCCCCCWCCRSLARLSFSHFCNKQNLATEQMMLRHNDGSSSQCRWQWQRNDNKQQ